MMDTGLRRGAAFSAGLHLLVVLALLVSIPFARPPEPPDTSAITMEFVGPPKPIQKGQAPAATPAPAPAPVPTKAPPAPTPPTKAPPKPSPPL
ncbi:MAG TPA: energy transducer TonB, partial [Acetobacteraceae bacterium]|nr:energy transducer TonB [Acetobacteraceae bacterium]